MTRPRERAKPMAPEERMAEIIAAARPLIVEHGKDVSTKAIADAAGIAEGTLFRVFATKDDLVHSVLDHEFQPDQFLLDVAAIDLTLPLRDRMVLAAGLLQRRFTGIFEVMAALGVPRPPRKFESAAMRRKLAEQGVVRVIEPDADKFRLPPDEVVRLLRILVFADSHPHISEREPMTPEQIVDIVLHGTFVSPATNPGGRP